jgi:CHAT domain-containing protein
LTAQEMHDLELAADLVVCSACETARGAYLSGEGLEGMTGILLSAGARCVIASLWPVHDRSTASLMTYLYAAVLEGRSPASALRWAKLELRATYPQPFYWAPFIAVGAG